MTVTKDILGITVGLQSTALMGKSYKMAKKSFSPKGLKTKPMLRGFTDTMIGIGFITPTAKMVNDLP